jgi:membrane-bound metal-dependent hydrolase YbcI (DUF457 family)
VNFLEVLLAAALFALAVVLSLYVGYLTVELMKLKYVFEATRHSNCNSSNSPGSLVLSTCIRLYFNGAFVVEVYNITGDYPYTS